MIKPSSSEVQEIARITTLAIKADIDQLNADDHADQCGIINEYDIIQLKIEQVLTATIQRFETELKDKGYGVALLDNRELNPNVKGVIAAQARLREVIAHAPYPHSEHYPEQGRE